MLEIINDLIQQIVWIHSIDIINRWSRNPGYATLPHSPTLEESIMRILLPAALLALSSLPAAAAAPVMQPGLYEITAQMVMKGMPMQMPASSFRRCITPQDIADGSAYASGRDNKDCTISHFKQSGNSISYDFSCVMQGHGSMVGRASGSSHASGYDMQTNGHFVPAMEGMGEFSQKMSAKRLGDCGK